MKTTGADIEEILSGLFAEIAALKSEVSRLNRLLDRKDGEISCLKKRLSKYEKPDKDSGNSSVPPTQDSLARQVVRHTKSLRKPSGRPSGGQKGHKGSCLSVDREPDERVDIRPAVCECCGKPLEAAGAEEASAHYTVDFRIVPFVTKHTAYRCRCRCGHTTVAGLPEGMRPGTGYGTNVQALVTYLMHEQCIPSNRIVRMMADVFGMPLSEGTVYNVVRRLGDKARYAYGVIRQRIESSHVVGGDETGAYAGGRHGWAWVFQNRDLTYLFFDRSRGIKAVEKHFKDGLPHSVIVSDRHSTYSVMRSKGRQVCLAHLLRNLEYLNELDTGQHWSADVQQVLRDAINLRKTPDGGLPGKDIVRGVRDRMDRLLDTDLSMLDKDFESLRHGIAKVRDHLFTFLVDKDVPPDNNGSERAVRMIKVKQKVSGCFRTAAGADIYAMLRSIMDTAHKNKQSKYGAMLALANL